MGLLNPILKKAFKGVKVAPVEKPKKTEQMVIDKPAEPVQPIPEAQVAPEKQVVPDAQAMPEQQITPEVTPAKPEPAVKLDETKMIPEGQVAEEAERIRKLSIDGVDQTQTHQPNFDYIDTDDDVKVVIADMAERNKSVIDESRRNVITNEQLKGLASDLDVSEDVIKQVMERETGGILNAETLLAARQVLNSSANKIIELAEKVRLGQAGAEEMLNFRRQLEFHKTYQAQFMGARAEVGRALQMFKIPAGTDAAQTARMSELVNTVQGDDLIKTAQAIAMAGDVQGINKIARTHGTGKTMSVLQEVFINSILSGIKTQVVNLSGNALFQTMNVAETAVAARIGRALSTEEGVLVGEASANIYGMFNAWQDALRLSWKAIKTGEASDSVHKLEMPVRRAISSENLEVSGMLGRAIDGVGSVIRIPTERLLLGGDEFFKTFARRADLFRSAYRHGMEQRAAKGLDDDQTAQAIREFLENPEAVGIKQARRQGEQAAEDYALYTTFQNPLGKTGRDIQGVVNRTGALKFIAPFIRTPINIFKAGVLERSPVALFTKSFHAELKKGGRARDLALARVSMGSLTSGTVAMYVGSGAITGGGPSNYEARQALEATGWKPYSIVSVGPDGKLTYQQYNRAEPFAYIVGAVADMVEISQYIDNEDDLIEHEKRINDISAAIVAGIAQNTMSKTFMQGIADFSEVMSDPRRHFKPWADRMAAAMIPYSGLRRDLSRIQDPVIREAWTLIDKIKRDSGFGLSEDLPPSRDLFGDIRYHPRSDMLGVLSPFPYGKQTDDRVKLEVANVLKESHKVPLTKPSKTIEGHKLTAKQYERLILISRKEAEIAGNNFHEALTEIIDSEVYLEATPDMRHTMIKDAQNRYDKLARAILLDEDEDLRYKLNERKAKKARNLYGEENLPENMLELLK